MSFKITCTEKYLIKINHKYYIDEDKIIELKSEFFRKGKIKDLFLFTLF